MSNYTYIDADSGITFDYSIVDCSEDYVDCDIYAVMPSSEEYLLRVYAEVIGDDEEPNKVCKLIGPFSEWTVRYSANRTDTFDDCENEAPQSLKTAYSKIESHVRKLIEDEWSKNMQAVDHEVEQTEAFNKYGMQV